MEERYEIRVQVFNNKVVYGYSFVSLAKYSRYS